MTSRDEIIAISEYYNIPLRMASARRDIIDENEMEYIMEWWMAKKSRNKKRAVLRHSFF